MDKLKITWTEQAKEDLKQIYKYWKKKTLQGANNVRSDILNSPKTILFSEQYQIDEVNQKYRRIVVRDNYKVLYKVVRKTIYVLGIVGTGQSPETLEKK